MIEYLGGKRVITGEKPKVNNGGGSVTKRVDAYEAILQYNQAIERLFNLPETSDHKPRKIILYDT